MARGKDELAQEFPTLADELRQEATPTDIDPKTLRLARDYPSLARDIVSEAARSVAGAQQPAPERVEAWRRELLADEEVLAGREDLRAFLHDHGGAELVEQLGALGDNPAVVRALTRLAVAAKKGGRR